MGDPNGIGTEVLIRALQFLHPFQNWDALIFGDVEILTKMNEALGAPFSFEVISKNYSMHTNGSADSFCIPVIDLSVEKNRNHRFFFFREIF